jgi:hypothetical protein
LRISSSVAVSLAAVGLGVLALSCGGKSLLSPSSETPTPAPPRPTRALPKTPAPVGAVTCPIGPGSATAVCKKGPAQLGADVDAAIDQLIQQAPAIFNLSDASPAGSTLYRVLDKDAYVAGVLDNLRTVGLCADRDYTTLQLIQVKNGNDSSEDYSIYTAKGYVNRSASGYQDTCKPASFPIDADPNGPPAGSGCGRPYPPPISKMSLEILLHGSGKFTLDSTPVVGPDRTYCAAVGFTDGRSFCQLRAEGGAFTDRAACELYLVGQAVDTGTPGPTWARDGNSCTGPDSGCDHVPDNPFQLWVYAGGGGSYSVCADNDVCGSLDVNH